MSTNVLESLHRAISFRRGRLTVSLAAACAAEIVGCHPSLSRGARIGLALVLTLGTGLTALAASGDLDPTFGTGGKVITDFAGSGGQAYALVALSDGRLAAAGSGKLALYKADGTPDDTFGDHGTLTTNIETNALLLQGDKLIVGGIAYGGSNSDFVLARYDMAGQLDPGFGNSGKVLTDFGGSSDGVYALVMQPDGMLVAAGRSFNGSQSNFALARYSATGQPDASFGNGGKVITDFGGSIYGPRALVMQGDRLVAAGDASAGSGHYGLALARYNADGTLDTSFGPDHTGKVISNFAYAAFALIGQSDGKLVAAGGANTVNGIDFALARFNADGSLDTGFGTGGWVVTDFATSFDVALALVQQPDGRLVAAGAASNGVSYGFALARYDSAGNLDTSFGNQGKVITHFSANADVAYADDEARALVLQPTTQKLVAAGYAYNGIDFGSNAVFALARYETGGQPIFHTLTVNKDSTGTGTGTVTSDDPLLEINCGSACVSDTGTYNDGVPVTLTATPDSTSTFAEWSGACSGVGTVTTVTMNADMSCTAKFNFSGGLPDLTGRWEIIGQFCNRNVCLLKGRFTVLNQSNQPVPAGVRVSFYLSSDSTFDPTDPFLRQVITSVPLNSSSDTAPFNLSFPFVKANALGKYVVAWVDPDPSSVQESNETNNVLVSPQIQ